MASEKIMGLTDDELIGKYENGKRIPIKSFEKHLKRMTVAWVHRSMKKKKKKLLNQ